VARFHKEEEEVMAKKAAKKTAKKTKKKTAKKISKKKASRSRDLKKNVENYEHTDTKRLNNPQVGLVNTKTEKAEKKKKYEFDPHLSPELVWASKAERTSFELPTVSLHTHEKIDPKTIIEAVRSEDGLNWEQLNLFQRPINKLSFIKEIQFYQHEKEWSNRLIAGDSLLVMNSLLEKEGFGGKVQAVYFDPPYGIKYGSNFQPFIDKRDVGDTDKDLASEPETLRAFRDTWELGVHSYLSYMRDRLLLCHGLLNDSGAIFVQISDENLHHLRELLDEVFGAENFVSIISYSTTSGHGSKYIANTQDFILFYAKKKNELKFNHLYEDKKLAGEKSGKYRSVELSNGETRPITKEEYSGREPLPEGARVFTLGDLTSKGWSEKGSFNFEFEGKTYVCPSNSHWKTNLEGMKRLVANRRVVSTGKRLMYKRYLDDFPLFPISNQWTDTSSGFSLSDPKVYAVQTRPLIVERCLQMVTDPGDLVFDPTCGSGTTAMVAEKWGRRWITCDTSRVAVTLAKQRLMTSIFDYFQLAYPEEGVASGFVYSKAERITIKSIAQSEKPETVDKVNDPIVDKTKARVMGPFTVEAVPAPIVKMSDEDVEDSYINGPKEWMDELLKTGIRLKGGEVLGLSRLEPLQGTRWLHAEGDTSEEIPQRVVVSFGPDFAPLEQKQVEMALQEAETIKPSPTIIVFAAFQFDPEASKDIDDLDWGGVTILKVQMNADLFTDDLKKKRSGNESFWLIGRPDITLVEAENKKWQVQVNGFDYYNTKSGTVESGGQGKIAMWMLDTDYDGRSVLPRQVFFPMAGKKEGWANLAKTLKAEIDEELIEAYRGVESLPFELGEHRRIAVKIVDDRGIESLIVEDVQ
jgi:adenine-specific DNA-methyltransferase